MSFEWCVSLLFFFKQKTAYEMRISDWSSDVCSSDLDGAAHQLQGVDREERILAEGRDAVAANEPLALPLHLLALVSDALEIVGRRRVAGQLVDAAEIGRAPCRERVCQYV